MCELPNGNFVFVESEEECVQMSASCSALCVGESCMSYRFGLDGACFVNVSNEIECDAYGVSHSVMTTYTNGVCVLEDAAAGGGSSCSEVLVPLLCEHVQSLLMFRWWSALFISMIFDCLLCGVDVACI